MANVNFHSQLASIMEVLANAAVAEICQLVDDGYAVLRLEISRTQRENLALKSKLRLVEVRSRDRLPRRSPVPHLVVSCGRKAHAAVKHSSYAKRTTGPILLGNLECHPSGAGEQTAGSPDQPQVILVKEEELVDGDTQLDIGVTLPPSLPADDQTVEPPASEDHRRPSARPPGPYRPDTPPDPAQRLQEEAGDPSGGLRAGQAGGDRQGDADQHTQPPYGGDAAVLSSQTEDGHGGGVDPSCCFPAGAVEAAGSFGTEGPLGELARGAGACGIAPPQTALDWKAEDGLCGRVDALKMEGGGMHSAWDEPGRAFQTGLCLVPIPGRDGEGVKMASRGAACDSAAESRSSEPDGGGFDSSSFDELFSSSDLSAAVQASHRDDGGGGEGLPSYLFPPGGGGGGGFAGLADPSSRARPPAPERVLRCDQCGRLFHNPRDLVVHQRSHAGERLFHCPQCKKPFLHLHQLKTHQRVHTGEKPFSCAQCGRRFSQSSHIKRHMSVHTGEKRYCCSLCGKRFSQACSLKVHQSVHTGERPYSCTQCGKSFSVLGNLVRHQSVHIRK